MIRKFGLIAGCVLLLNSCTSHFITDDSLRGKVSDDFASRAAILEASGVELEAMNISKLEKEALEFMYAYMPLGDIVNREQSFYLDQYRMTRRALKEMPWGKSIPEREMRHFVLPVRVNNESRLPGRDRCANPAECSKCRSCAKRHSADPPFEQSHRDHPLEH